MVTYSHWNERVDGAIPTQSYPKTYDMDGKYTAFHEFRDEMTPALAAYFGYTVASVVDSAVVDAVICVSNDGNLCHTASKMWGIDLRDVARAAASGQKDGPPDPGDNSKRWLWGVMTGVYAYPGAQYFDLMEALDWAVPNIEGAATKTWSAAGASSWSVDASWSGGTKPAAADDVVFDGTSVQTCTIDEVTAALTSFSVNAGYTGTINANTGQGTTVGLHGAGTFAGAFTLNTTLGSGGRVFNFTTFTMSAGTVAVGAGRQIRPSNTVNISAGTWTTGRIVTESTTSHNFTASITLTELDIQTTAGTPQTITNLANLTVSSTINVASSSTTILTTFACAATTVTCSSGCGIGNGGTGGDGAVTFTTGTLAVTGALAVGASATQNGSLSFTTGACTVTTTSSISASSDITYSGAGVFTQTQEMTLNGTFTAAGVAATISIASARTAASFGLVVASGATCNLGTGAVTLGSFQQNGGGAVTMTSGTTTINGRQSGGDHLYISLGAGSFAHNNGTINVTQTVGGALFEIYSSVSFYNFTQTAANTTTTYATSAVTLTIANNLTVTAGGVNTRSGVQTAVNLTVTAATSIATASTLTLNASTCIFNGTGTSWGYSLQTNGTGSVNMGSATVTAGSVAFGDTGSSTLTSGTLTINSVSTGGLSLTYNLGPTVAHNSGTVTFTRAGSQLLYESANTARSLYDVTINNASNTTQFANGFGFALTVAGAFTISAGTFDTEEVTSGTDRNLTVTGTSSITGTLDCNASTISLGSGYTTTYATLVNTGGTLTATSATFTTGSLGAAGTATVNLPSGMMTVDAESTPNDLVWALASTNTVANNSGTVQFTGAVTSRIQTGAKAFYNLTVNNASASHTLVGDAATVSNNLVLTAGTILTAGLAWTTTGTSSITGTMTLSTSAATYTGAVTINSGGTIGKNSGTGTLTYSSTVTTAAGGTLSLTGAGMTVTTASASAFFIVNGTATITGASGNNISVAANGSSGGPVVDVRTGSTISFQYVTMTQNGANAYGLRFLSGTTTVTQLDTLTLTGNTRAALQNAMTTLITLTNGTLSNGTSGANWYEQTVIVGTGSRLQLSNSTYTTAGLEATSGWVSSITDQGVANAHVFYGILNASAPDASYEIAATDNVTTKNADAYSVSFDTALTVDQAEVCAGLTISASTTATVNTTISLQHTGAASISGTLNASAATTTLDSDGSVTIASGGTLSAPNATGTFNFSGATFDTNGAYTANSGTLNFDGSGAQSFLAGSVTTYNNISASAAAATVTQSEAATFGGTFVLTAGAARAWTTSAALSITGAVTVGASTTWTMNASTTLSANVANSGTTALSGGAITLTMATATTLTSTGTLTLSGTANSRARLRSSSTGNAVNIIATGTVTATYMDVKDSDASGGNAIYAEGSIDSGGNSNWIFAEGAETPEIRFEKVQFNRPTFVRAVFSVID